MPTTKTVDRLLREAENLKQEDLLQLVYLLLERIRRIQQSDDAPDLDELRGKIDLPEGFDAQKWVSQLRSESERDYRG